VGSTGGGILQQEVTPEGDGGPTYYGTIVMDEPPIADGGETASEFRPGGLAVDAIGNLYIADPVGHRVMKMDTSGFISTIAGSGIAGDGGDGGPAIDAELNTPSFVAVGGNGEVYISETVGDRVRKIDNDGIITTVAGSGAVGYGGDGGPATGADLGQPYGLAADAGGNLYIADPNNFRVRRVDDRGIITTAAGNGAFGATGAGVQAIDTPLPDPIGLATDGEGNLFIADPGSNAVRKVDDRGIMTTVAGSGSCGVSLQFPSSVALDAQGTLFIGDENNHRILKMGAGGVFAVTILDSEDDPAQPHPIAPTALAVDAAGNLYVSDYPHHRIHRLDWSGAIATVADTNSFKGYGGPATTVSVEQETIAAGDCDHSVVADAESPPPQASDSSVSAVDEGGSPPASDGDSEGGGGGALHPLELLLIPLGYRRRRKGGLRH
jgi:sugar lactone lactonase YvrE